MSTTQLESSLQEHFVRHRITCAEQYPGWKVPAAGLNNFIKFIQLYLDILKQPRIFVLSIN